MTAKPCIRRRAFAALAALTFAASALAQSDIPPIPSPEVTIEGVSLTLSSFQIKPGPGPFSPNPKPGSGTVTIVFQNLTPAAQRFLAEIGTGTPLKQITLRNYVFLGLIDDGAAALVSKTVYKLENGIVRDDSPQGSGLTLVFQYAVSTQTTTEEDCDSRWDGACTAND